MCSQPGTAIGRRQVPMSDDEWLRGLLSKAIGAEVRAAPRCCG